MEDHPAVPVVVKRRKMVTGIIALLTMAVAAIEDFIKKEISLWIIILSGIISAFSGVFYIISGNAKPIDIAFSLIPGGLILLLAFVSREGIGYGDGLLILALGPALGLRVVVLGLVVAFFASGIVSAVLLVVKRARKGYMIPFVPFMTLGLGVCLIAQV